MIFLKNSMMELFGKAFIVGGRNLRLVNNFIKIVSRSCLSFFSVDLLDTQNVYSSLTHLANWSYTSLEINNIVFSFSKTSCSTGYDKKKCMGNTRSDQFNSKFIKHCAKITSIFDELSRKLKVGCIFPMVISSKSHLKSRMGE